MTPYERNQAQWEKDIENVKKIAEAPKITFRQYCELSEYLLNAPEEWLLDKVATTATGKLLIDQNSNNLEVKPHT